MNVSKSRLSETSLLVIAGVAFATVLIYTRSILIPFVIAIFIYSAMIPVISFTKNRLKFSKGFTVAVSIILFFGIALAVFVLVFNSAKDFIESAELYKGRINDFSTWLVSIANKLKLDMDAGTLQSGIKNLPFFSMAKNISGTLFSLIGNATLITIFVLFMIMGSNPQGSKSSIISMVQLRISKYVNVKLLTSFFTALIVGIVLWIFGVELAFMFAVLTFLLNLIPSIGSIIATILPLPVIFLQFGIGWQIFVVLALTGGVQFFIGSIFEPKLMGQAMGLHPVTILLFLMFWGLVWGVAGMFLAVPITAAMKIIFEQIEATKPVAKMLEGKFE